MLKNSSLNIVKPLFYGAAFFLALSQNYSQAASLKIAVVDTGFCPDKASVKSKNQEILSMIDMTGTLKYDCNKVTSKELEESGRFHGQHVLNEFLHYLSPRVDVTITPLVIYDHTGTQTADAWKKSISWIEKEKIDFVLTASGFINANKLVNTLPSIWFIPSGRLERMIDEKTSLFPQNLAPKENIFMIGDYYDGAQTLYDQALKYPEQIDYYFPSASKHKDFVGTSRAVAQAMANAIDKCVSGNRSITAKALRVCLQKKEKILKDPVLKKEFKTF